ncbi:SAM-dependent methyltransferase [Methanomicrobium sp. W14]|uniref:class I SAM-dependent methyltransferase n=1 Tax=Methanomicrobium sp. W14 TaxID=2817839 RepID=UPI001AE60731|nr:class I SAM-dependent methyltransferase [Methanomicrobium sp. W14]MBP2134392.1 SAM-dependent methyltransferase [Methanomicrobium sp. W14]
MTQEDNLDSWSRLWEETTTEVHDDDDETKTAVMWNKIWDKRSKNSEKSHGDDKILKKSAEETVQFLKENGFCIKGSSVLDIGCGMGALSLPLAREGAAVTALDISATSLEKIKETAEKEGLSVDTTECSWWTADIDKLGFRRNFDLVIASRTASVNDTKSFEKMIACSKNMCYYSSFLSFADDEDFRKICMTVFGGIRENDRTAKIHHAYNMFFPLMHLYFSGIEPVVKIDGFGRNVEMPFEKAAEAAIMHLSRDHEPDESAKEKIFSYYREVSVNGMYKAPSRGCHGMMVWRVI